jgi:hypothetical protein
MRHVLFFLIWCIIFYIVNPLSTCSGKAMSDRMSTPVWYGFEGHVRVPGRLPVEETLNTHLSALVSVRFHEIQKDESLMGICPALAQGMTLPNL